MGACDLVRSGEQNRRVVVGVDIGGTKLALGLVDYSGNIVDHRYTPTDTSNEEALVRQVEEIVRDLVQTNPHHTPVGLGVGLPGAVDPDGGVAVAAVNLPWHSLDIVGRLESSLSLPTFIENDANAGALGEKWFGRRKGCADFIYLTIGTGIGAGIVTGGRLLRGGRLASGEVGHMIVDVVGPRCRCGARGCLESLAAGPAIARRMQERAGAKESANQGRVTAEQVIRAAQAGETTAVQVLEETANHLACGFINLWRLFTPTRILLGGGVVLGWGESLVDMVSDAILKLWPQGSSVAQALAISNLHQMTGVLGAAAVLMERENEVCEDIPAVN